MQAIVLVGPSAGLLLEQWRSPSAGIPFASSMRARHCKRRGRNWCGDLRSRCRVALAFIRLRGTELSGGDPRVVFLLVCQMHAARR
jgi:hypothetical protein